MSVASPQIAVREILTLFKTAWDTTGHIALYEDVPPTPAQSTAIETGVVVWARASVKHNSSEQATLAGYNGEMRFDTIGVVIVEIYVPSGSGLTLARNLATLVRDAYRKATTPGGIWFRRERFNEIGPSGQWVRVNVTVEFLYDEVKT